MNDSTGNAPAAEYFLRPGFIFVPSEPTTISVVLGSAVSVFLYDKKRLIGGTNHFRFPYENRRGKTTSLYGNVATIALIRMVREAGAGGRGLEAQIFGGAFNPGISSADIGRENLETARRILQTHRIRVVSEDVGGEKGRKVVVQGRSHEVAILKVDRLRKEDWHPYDSDR